ncbi:hypothetical protein DI09_49p150 [Mitosporidium daphniae]|uniref:Uncharacterized protein n=1 Tax=Mitosporidium daphniae TaxID=1485682 RepID=A0A098VPU5_9MICR|nr:uncharacterized protein DI09_49p150 [Mitosporidium daphniae]KGG50985.1 hypothetical protein DI09_49p150 [Mitosporidium daphniae]|eukprot:XP_013237412.1 uncharacterized protein DI09_49p150 [Mitosporidium daphniae]
MSTGNPNHPNGNVKLDLALDDIIKSGRPQKGSSTVPRAEKSRKWEHDMFSRKKRDHQHRRDRHHRGPEKRHATNWGYLIKISNLHWEVTKDDVKVSPILFTARNFWNRSRTARPWARFQ